jgi:FkbM family methyltransferase
VPPAVTGDQYGRQVQTNPEHLRPPERSIRPFLASYARRKRRAGDKVFCLQVGANDGRINDPVYPHLSSGWHGLLIEPQVDVFEEQLSVTYANHSGVQLANVALAPTEGTMPFYRIAISDARWATGLSSFVRESLEQHITSGYVETHAAEEGIVLPRDADSLVSVVDVPTEPLSMVLDRYDVRVIDVFCVDTEGYDFEIIKMLDLEQYSPDVLVFESKNLSDEDYIAAKKLLTTAGYCLYWDRGDTLAVKEPYPPMTARFDEIRDKAKKGLRRVKERAASLAPGSR